MVNNWNVNLATRIYFGANVVESALKKEKNRLNKNICIVTTGRTLERLGYIDKLVSIITENNGAATITIIKDISQNPQLEEVKKAITIGKKARVELVIGFGGGSALDAAKAVALGIGAEDSIEEYYVHGKEASHQTLPIIAIPTTAGTGSELSKAAILSDKETKRKAGIRGEALLPCVAIVDVAYTYSLPKNITMETGFDALAHSIESYLAAKANKFTEMISEQNIKSIGQYLPKLCQCLEDEKAREEIAYASMLAGINLANAGTCFPHRMQYVIAAHTETNHSEGLIAIYPSWIKYEYEVNKEKINDILIWLGQKSANNGEEAKKYFMEFLAKIEVQSTLVSLGIKAEELSLLAHEVSGDLSNDRLFRKEDVKEKIFQESYEEGNKSIDKE